MLPLQEGVSRAGNPWKKQEYVLETEEQYPRKVCFNLFGDKVDQYPAAIGDDVTVSFDLESREFNGRWYTDVRAWKIEKSAPAAQGHVERRVGVFGVCFCVIYFGMSLNACAAPLQFVNSSLYYQAKTKKNATGFVMSLYVFPVQLGIALSSGIVNWLLAAMGYEAGAVLSASQTVSLQNIILVIPAVMMAVALLANILYPLGEKKMGEVYAKLNEQK